MVGFKGHDSRATIFQIVIALGLSVVFAAVFIEPLAAQTAPPTATYPALPSETPAEFKPATDSFDYAKRDVMISMRDGCKASIQIAEVPGTYLRTSAPSDATTHGARLARRYMRAHFERP
jgi:hypothetical protein